jgi:UV DNA damage endonuclease
MMLINLGYVAISMKLKEASPNKTVTLKTLEKVDKSLWTGRVEEISKVNISNTIRILRYNKAYGIKLYRFTSKLVPFATHQAFSEWDWRTILKDDFSELGNVVKETGMRVSTHPDHFTLLNSPKKEVLESSIRDLEYHCYMFELMGLGNEYKMVLHVGGMYKQKDDSIKRFYEGFSQLDERIRKRIILENDDKLYNVEDVLKICKDLKIPMVLDIHHDKCNPSSYKVKDIINEIFGTWEKESFPPKIHVSSPKCEKEMRSHHEYINTDDFIGFIKDVQGKVNDFDVMIEAKNKDLAVFKLMNEISKYDFIQKTDEASIEVN